MLGRCAHLKGLAQYISVCKAAGCAKANPWGWQRAFWSLIAITAVLLRTDVALRSSPRGTLGALPPASNLPVRPFGAARCPQLTFTPDSREKDVSIMHRLKLYESENTPSTTKKPVMSEVSGCGCDDPGVVGVGV